MLILYRKAFKEMDITLVEDYINKYRLAPRDINLAAKFIKEYAKGSKFLIYGAGSHTKALLEEFKKIDFKPDIKGIIDKYTKGNLLGYKIYDREEIKYITEDIDMIILSHHEFEHGMIEDLYEANIKIPVFQVYTSKDFIKFSSAHIKLDLHISTEKPIILFVSLDGQEVVKKELIKKLKDNYFTIKSYLGRNGIKEENKDFYHIQINLKQSFSLLFELIEKYKPVLIYIQDYLWMGNFLASYLKVKFPHLKIVGDYYEMLRFYFDNPVLSAKELVYHFTQEDIEVNQWGEDNSRLLDGVIVKERGIPLEEFYKNTNVLYYSRYVPRNYNKYIHKDRPSNNIVYTGGIVSSLLAERFADPKIVFEKLIKLGFTVHLYINEDSWENILNYYPDYVELSRKTGKLFINTRLPEGELIETISLFDYGILPIKPVEATKNERMDIKTGFPSKLYTYISAGLPILTNSMEGMTGKFIEQYGIGKIIINIDDIKHITDKEYLSFKENLKKVQEEFCLENQEKRFFDFLTQIIQK